ncbi:ferric citrate ABC transporter ATP-binding protein FecE [Marinobacterium zhoushanense]|uniref:Ferric citrate ABC transporter ATP-binding protein FecE n=1 Tax=Marinobacterium zhoushanense TaxID=1679163 RepID=A0ABQ1KHT2_9GAMM|nr:Fe(3+) dicitrate ABC transporter ATP-binding protein FecE [Marinobacterium zhoushanense]GGB96763.1 ferric citrate ABC transporter ATP-binding protein FecE [Marinobacterium zhoushanense]
MLETRSLSAGYGRTPVVKNLNLQLPEGRITALIGPNGCGKSTLLKTLARVLKPLSGEVLMRGAALHRLDDRAIARQLSMLPQTPTQPEGISVRQLVEYGRAPYLSHWGRLKAEDRQRVDLAMRETGVHELAERPLSDLSGGQRQRVWIAMILAQDTDLVLLDEPTTYLDLAHQIELLQLLQQLNRNGKTIVVVLHDLNQACRYCDHLVVLREGQLVTQGSPDEVFDAELLATTFSLSAQVIRDPVAGTPMCIPL